MSLPKKVLVVCLGNICRSPVAEYVLRDYINQTENPRLKQIIIQSAGLNPVFFEMSANSERYLKLKGISAPHFHSKQISRSMIEENDQIFVLERYMKEEIIKNLYSEEQSREKEINVKKILTLTESAGEKGDVEDPYGSNYAGYEKICLQIDGLCKKIVDRWIADVNP
jgi:protein-tyrosine phosphatase